MLLSSRIIAGLALLSATGAAFAAYPKGVYDTKNVYYTDATHTVVAGTVHYECNGETTRTGVQTQFNYFVGTPCDEGAGQPTESGGGGGDPIYTNCSLYYDPYPVYMCAG